MKLIITSKGVDHICLYDREDHALISQFKWSMNSQGYAVTRKDGRVVSMHRLLLNITDPAIHCDHRNHNKIDNRRSNLRVCTPSQNQHNRRKQKSSSNFKGVTLFQGKYFAQIRSDNTYHYLGLYRNERTAGRVYDAAARRLHGAFACTNELAPLPQQIKLPI